MSHEPLRARPGRLDLRVFDQDQVWLDILGVPHALHEMTTTHRANVIRHLYEHAAHYHGTLAIRLTTQSLLPDLHGIDPPDMDAFPEDPTEWIEGTPLMRRLRKMTPDWERHVTEDRDELTDQDTGTWTVETENSVYLLDLDARTSTRRPNLAGGLRRDGETLPLLHLVQCQRAQPGQMLLDVRDDGISTLRMTSLVRRITRAEPV